jgi:hypothetical protein
MGEQEADPTRYFCVEPGCGEQVVYQRQEVPGLAYDGPSGPRTVYLECPLGHIHSYQLNQ